MQSHRKDFLNISLQDARYFDLQISQNLPGSTGPKEDPLTALDMPPKWRKLVPVMCQILCFLQKKRSLFHLIIYLISSHFHAFHCISLKKMAEAKKLWIFSVFDNPKPVRGVSRPRPLSAVSQGFQRMDPWLTFGDHFWDCSTKWMKCRVDGFD